MSITRPWVSLIPVIPKLKDRKRCYTVWTKIGFSKTFRSGGKVVWLTDAELTLAYIKYPNKTFYPVLERDALEEYKKYLDATIE